MDDVKEILKGAELSKLALQVTVGVIIPKYTQIVCVDVCYRVMFSPTFVSLRDSDQEGVVRNFVALSCELGGFFI